MGMRMWMRMWIMFFIIIMSQQIPLWQLSKTTLPPLQNQQQFENWKRSLPPIHSPSQYPQLQHKIIQLGYLLMVIHHQYNVSIALYLLVMFPFTFRLKGSSHPMEWVVVVGVVMVLRWVYRYVWYEWLIGYLGVCLYMVSAQNELLYLGVYGLHDGHLPLNSILYGCMIVFVEGTTSHLIIKVIGYCGVCIWNGLSHELMVVVGMMELCGVVECMDGLMNKSKKQVYGNEGHIGITAGWLILYSIIDNNMSFDQLILVLRSDHLMDHVIDKTGQGVHSPDHGEHLQQK